MLLKNLRCEWLTSPLVDVAAPRLTWEPSSSIRSDAQTGYQIQCGTTFGSSDLWDSGKVLSATTLAIYAGVALTSRKVVFYRIRARDASGVWSQWSYAQFEMGLLAASDWKNAVMSGFQTGTDATKSAPAPHIRKDFTVASGKVVKSARLYATALGVYRPYLNGQRVGNLELAPGWTDFNVRFNYQAYDVTKLIRTGAANALGLALGDGWGVGNLNVGYTDGSILRGSLYGVKFPYGMAVLYIDYEGGTTDVIVTDGSWKATTSANQSNDLYNGATTDGRRALNFTDPTVDPTNWPAVVTMAAPTVPIQAPKCQPIRRLETISPVAAPSNPAAGVFVYDMGANHACVLRIAIRGASAGQVVTVTPGERLKADGTIYTDNYRTAKAIYTFVCSGAPVEVFEPLHAQLAGRYFSVSGYPGVPAKTDLQTIRIGADLKKTGAFSCSNATLNSIFAMTERSLDANSMSGLTDCPQRDERLHWAFDIVASVNCLMLLRDAAAFMQKGALDADDAAQADGSYSDVAPRTGFKFGNVGWHQVYCFTPLAIYQVTGDASVISKRFAQMIKAFAKEGSLSNNWNDFIGAETTDANVLINSFGYRAAQLMAIGASAADITQAANIASRQAAFKSTFQTYINTSTGSITGDTQCAYILALAWGLCQDAATASLVMAKLKASIAAKGLVCGLIGASYLLEALTLNGEYAYAQSLAMDQTQGWAKEVVQGLTTSTERFDSFTSTASTNSLNHHVRGGPIAEWLFRRVGGIDPDPAAPGLTHVYLRPMPGSLTSGAARFESPRGTFRSNWSITPNGFAYDFEVPPGCTADVVIPSNNVPKEAGVAVTLPRTTDPLTGFPSVRVGSGVFSWLA